MGSANLTALFSKDSIGGVNIAKESADEVVALARGVICRKPPPRPSSGDKATARLALRRGKATRQERAERWRSFDAGLKGIQARLARTTIPFAVFEADLISSWRCQGSRNMEHVHQSSNARNGCINNEPGPGTSTGAEPFQERCCEWPLLPVCVLWRLHDSGLLSMSRLLETNEISPSDVEFRWGGEGRSESLQGPSEDLTDTIVRDLRELARESAEEVHHLGHEQRRKIEINSPLCDVAHYLFDVGYRELPAGFAAQVGGEQAREALSRRAARRVLDHMCCGQDLFGGSCSASDDGTDTGTRLRGCAAVFSAIDPLPFSCISAEPDTARCFEERRDSCGSTTALSAIVVSRDKGAPHENAAVLRDEPTAGFLARQLRLLFGHASGLSGLIDSEDASEFDAKMSVAGECGNILVDIMQHFCSAQLVDALRSICQRAVDLASDITGSRLLKPLLQWDTLGPIVRAGASAHAESIPPAVAAIGTELAGAAINVVPAGDSDAMRVSGCTQDQGVLVLLMALRLVANADGRSNGAPFSAPLKDGLYIKWMHSCFGVAVTAGDSGIAQEGEQVAVDHFDSLLGREQRTKSFSRCGDTITDITIQGNGSEVVRAAMEKQGATEVLMKALCSTVPYDSAFILEVHRDVVKAKLRASFSIQVRDYLDLVETRLSDLSGLRGQAGYRKCRATRKRGDCSPKEAEDGAVGMVMGEDGDPTKREIGFFLRQFKQTGHVPPALKTAILWQPKSWTKYRKVLLAAPGERVTIPDDRGKFAAASDGDVKETIGRGGKGLRVEVSLKYRRLLVQQLAKDKLLSKKDHEAFRQSYVEFLQGQRDRDSAKRSGNEHESMPLTSMTRQLLLLEPRVGGKQLSRDREGDGILEAIYIKKDFASVQQKLAVLLQEYLPRALVVELCLEDDESNRVSSKAPDGIKGYSSESPAGRDWFKRAVEILARILGEWERNLKTVGGASVEPSPRTQSRDVLVSTHLDATPQVVAEAILNSVHCCIAAVGVSLGQDLLAPLLDELRSTPHTSAGEENQGATINRWGQAERGNMGNQEPCPESAPDNHKAPTGFGGDGIVQAFRCISRIVATAAAVDVVGEALCKRCFSLLANPTRLDMKHVMSLAHVVASLPSALHPTIEDLWTKLVRRTLHRTSAGKANVRSKGTDRVKTHRKEGMGLVALAQIVALYLQSTILLHDGLATCTSESADNRSSRSSNDGDTFVKTLVKESTVSPKSRSSGRHPALSMRGGGRGVVGGRRNTERFLDGKSLGCAPVVLLDMAWWIERRLAIAHRRDEFLPAIELAGLSQLLRSVVSHPTVQGAFTLIFAKGKTSPPLKRVIALEVAVSRIEDFVTASTKVAFLESLILGRLLMNSAGGSECEIEGFTSNRQHRAEDCVTSTRLNASSDDAKDVRDIWDECVTVLIQDSSLRDAAQRRVYRDQAPQKSKPINYFGSCDVPVYLKSTNEHARRPSWAWQNCGRSCVGDGVQALLGCTLDVMGNLCTLESTACSISRKIGPKSSLNEPGQANFSHGKRKLIRRGVAMLLTETVKILSNTDATRKCAASSVLLLIAEVAIPIIGTSEGPAKALELLRLMWRKIFSRVRPLEYGVVVRLTRMFLMCYGAQRDEGADNYESDWVSRMLEDLPCLAVEMTRVWPSLARTLQSLIVLTDGDNGVGPPARGRWAVHLSVLHAVGEKLVQRLVEGDLGSSVQHYSPRDEGGGSRLRNDSRVPFGPVIDGSQGQKSTSDQSQPGKQSDLQKNLAYASDAPAVYERTQAMVLGIDELPNSPLRDASKALPRSLAAIIVEAVYSATNILVDTSKKRPRQAPTRSTVDTRKTKSEITAPRHGREHVPGSLHLTEVSHVASRSFPIGHKHPKPNKWVTGLLEPLFGRASEGCNISSLTSLLEAAVDGLVRSRTFNGEGRWEMWGDVERDNLNGFAESLTTSLAAGILGYAPSLVARLAETPFLVSPGTSICSSKKQRRSLAVLDCLKRFSEEVPQQHTTEPTSWLTAVLSHYGAALLSILSIRKSLAVEVVSRELSRERGWEELVAFVHAQVGSISPRNLRLIPAVVALQEVDPLLKQYF